MLVSRKILDIIKSQERLLENQNELIKKQNKHIQFLTTLLNEEQARNARLEKEIKNESNKR